MRIGRDSEETISLFSDIYLQERSYKYQNTGLCSGTAILLCHDHHTLPLPLHIARACSPFLKQFIDKPPCGGEWSPYEPLAISLPPEIPSLAVFQLYKILVQGKAKLPGTSIPGLRDLLQLLQIKIHLHGERLAPPLPLSAVLPSSHSPFSKQDADARKRVLTLSPPFYQATWTSCDQETYDVEDDDLPPILRTPSSLHPPPSVLASPPHVLSPPPALSPPLVPSPAPALSPPLVSSPAPALPPPLVPPPTAAGSGGKRPQVQHLQTVQNWNSNALEDIIFLKGEAETEQCPGDPQPLGPQTQPPPITDGLSSAPAATAGLKSVATTTAKASPRSGAPYASPEMSVQPVSVRLKSIRMLPASNISESGSDAEDTSTTGAGGGEGPANSLECRFCKKLYKTSRSGLYFFKKHVNQCQTLALPGQEPLEVSLPPQGEQTLSPDSNRQAPNTDVDAHKDSQNSSDSELFCQLCFQVYGDSISLKTHYIIEHLSEVFYTEFTQTQNSSVTVKEECRFCSSFTDYPKNLIVHIGIVHNKLPEFLPAYCVRAIENPQEKLVQIGTEHLSSQNNDDINLDQYSDQASVGSLKCFECEKVSHTTELFKHHLVTHFRSAILDKFMGNNICKGFKTIVPCPMAQCSYSGTMHNLAIHLALTHRKLAEFIGVDQFIRLFPKSNNVLLSDEGSMNNKNSEDLKRKSKSFHENESITKFVPAVASSSKSPLRIKPVHQESRPRHEKSIDKLSALYCHICSYSTNIVFKFKVHYFCKHYGEQVKSQYMEKSDCWFTCRICDYKSTLSRHVLVHIGKKHNKFNEFLPPKICKLKSGVENKPIIMIKKIPLQSLPKYYSCHICEIDLESMQRLRKHYLRHYRSSIHEKYLSNLPNLSDGYPNNCPLCSHTSANATHLVEHIGLVHSRIKDFLPSGVWAKIRKVNDDTECEDKKLTVSPVLDALPGSGISCYMCSTVCQTVSNMRKHLGSAHFQEKLVGKFAQKHHSGQLVCRLCNSFRRDRTDELAEHVAVVHNKLRLFLPAEVWEQLRRKPGKKVGQVMQKQKLIKKKKTGKVVKKGDNVLKASLEDFQKME